MHGWILHMQFLYIQQAKLQQPITIVCHAQSVKSPIILTTGIDNHSLHRSIPHSFSFRYWFDTDKVIWIANSWTMVSQGTKSKFSLFQFFHYLQVTRIQITILKYKFNTVQMFRTESQILQVFNCHSRLEAELTSLPCEICIFIRFAWARRLLNPLVLFPFFPVKSGFAILVVWRVYSIPHQKQVRCH